MISPPSPIQTHCSWKVSALAFLFCTCTALCAPPDLPLKTWTKLSPLPGGPPSPRLGYEGACVWDPLHGRLIRHAGHNQGGGGEQHAETWSFDPLTARWTLHEPNTYPPGLCCGQQNVFDPMQSRYLRFPSFSGSHGWQWWREIYLNDSSAWSYDLGENRWRNLRPFPTANPRPLRCASWDAHHGVVVMFGGETSREGTLVYDPYANAWTRMSPKVQPEFRSGGNMAYAAAHRRHVLFGAQFTNDAHTWAYDIRTNTWTDLQPPELPPTDKNDAVLAYDPFADRTLAITRVTEGTGGEAKAHLESWTYDAGANRWTKLNPPGEPGTSGNRARCLAFSPELNAFLLENRTHPPSGPPEQQILALRLSNIPAAGTPAAPRELRAVTDTSGAVTLNWKTAASAPASFVIYRGSGETPWTSGMRKVASVSGSDTSWRDSGLARRQNSFYAVYGANAAGHEHPAPALARTQPRLVDGIVVSVLAQRRVELTWRKSPEPDVTGYVVERAPVEVFTEDQLRRLKRHTPPLAEPSVGALHKVGDFVRVTSAPITDAQFTDTDVDFAKPVPAGEKPVYERAFNAEQFDPEGKPYRFAVFAYRVRAVNALGVESGPSPAVFTIPSPVQSVFSREVGPACDLKWAENSEKALTGYRVYRMNGRFDKEAIERLTPEAIRSLTYQDPGAGKASRRYYIVAVDALGQEGFPSAPVWFEREWKQFYKPFTGEWHQ